MQFQQMDSRTDPKNQISQYYSKILYELEQADGIIEKKKSEAQVSCPPRTVQVIEGAQLLRVLALHAVFRVIGCFSLALIGIANQPVRLGSEPGWVTPKNTPNNVCSFPSPFPYFPGCLR